MTAVKNGARQQERKQAPVRDFLKRAMREGITSALPCVRKYNLGVLREQRAVRDRKLLHDKLEYAMDCAMSEKLEEIRAGRQSAGHLSGTAVSIDCDLKEATFIINKPVDTAHSDSHTLYFERTEYKVGLDGAAVKISSFDSGPHYIVGFMKWDGLYNMI